MSTHYLEPFHEMVLRLSHHGEYVVPYDVPGGPPMGFVFDGASGVLDLDLESCATHDYDYTTGRYSKLGSDARYTWRLIKDKRPLWAAVRFLGLTVGGWRAWRKHRKRNSRDRIAERMVTDADLDIDVYVWPVRTWSLWDLRPAE